MAATPPQNSWGYTLSSRRDILLHTALDLFDQSGVRATGVDLILRHSGVAKMTLYKHFKSKGELVRQALELYSSRSFERFVSDYRAKSTGADSPKVIGVFDVVATWVADPSFRGPLLSRTCHELQYPDDVMRIVQAHDERMVEFLEAELAREAVPSAAPVARQIYLLLSGALEMARAHDWPNAVAQARAVARALLTASPAESTVSR